MFKIGQKVVCVNKDPVHALVIGKVYTIQIIVNCCGPSVNVGTNTTNGIPTLCNVCGHKFDDIGAFYHAFRFRPLEYTTCHEELIEKFKSPEEKQEIVKEPQEVDFESMKIKKKQS